MLEVRSWNGKQCRGIFAALRSRYVLEGNAPLVFHRLPSLAAGPSSPRTTRVTCKLAKTSGLSFPVELKEARPASHRQFQWWHSCVSRVPRQTVFFQTTEFVGVRIGSVWLQTETTKV
jgi:hypothetical protein